MFSQCVPTESFFFFVFALSDKDYSLMVKYEQCRAIEEYITEYNSALLGSIGR